MLSFLPGLLSIIKRTNDKKNATLYMLMQTYIAEEEERMVTNIRHTPIQMHIRRNKR
jgi:thymidylate synthase